MVRGLIVVLILIAGLGFYFFRRPKKMAPAPPSKVEQKAAPAAPASIAFPGKIRARHSVSVRATVNGEVGSFLVDPGQDVYEGQLLARIVNPGLETGRESAAKEVETAQAKINSLESAIIAGRLEASRAATDATRAKDESERTEKIYRRQAMLQTEGATPRLVYEKSKREFESAQADFQSLDALAQQAADRVASLTQEMQAAKRALDDKNQQLEETQANLAAADVHSPVTGMVVARRGEAGQMLGPGDAGELFRIAVDLSLLQAVFPAGAAALAKIQPGQEAAVAIPDLQVDSIPGTVKEVKGGEASVEFVSPNPNIRPGMNCSVMLHLK
ncbi:MAG: efflux RND transporter periplasmic adaptor subunit [Acidobacteriota bacterium]|nr:efflux RND transporter periplasmic adaptor subunit [Acidobacteriota bacterium]